MSETVEKQPSEPVGDGDPRAQLLELTRAAKALVEWHEGCGASGVLVDASPAEALALLDGPRAGAPKIAPRNDFRPDAAPRANVASSHSQVASGAVSRGSAAPEAAPIQPTRALPFERAEQAPQGFAGGARTHRPEQFVDTQIPVLPIAEKRSRLAVLEAEAKSCTACVLCEKRKEVAFSRGDAAAELCFIGEGPGADEDVQGLPFVGKAGQLLDKMIAGMGMQRDEVYICNIVKCRPPENREPLPAEVQACSHFLADQLEIVRPKVIVTLGNVPLKALFNVQGIMKLRGTWRLYKGTVPVMPTYHPAYVLRNPSQEVRGDVWNDLKQVMKQLGRAIPARKAQ